MSGSLTCVGGENVPGIPGADSTRNFTYLARGPCMSWWLAITIWIGNCTQSISHPDHITRYPFGVPCVKKPRRGMATCCKFCVAGTAVCGFLRFWHVVVGKGKRLDRRHAAYGTLLNHVWLHAKKCILLVFHVFMAKKNRPGTVIGWISCISKLQCHTEHIKRLMSVSAARCIFDQWMKWLGMRRMSEANNKLHEFGFLPVTSGKHQ